MEREYGNKEEYRSLTDAVNCAVANVDWSHSCKNSIHELFKQSSVTNKTVRHAARLESG
jgi:hypothetical protein